MGYSHRLRDLEERGQISGGATQDVENGYAGEAPLLERGVNFNGDGDVLDY